MKRRDFLQTAAAFVAAPAAVAKAGQETEARPNVVFLTTDQQSATMMSCAGNRWLRTPAMDYLAANGIRFERAFATNPVCSPARVSWMTGRFASDVAGRRVRDNGSSMRIDRLSEEVKRTTIAADLKQAGYDLVYVGKTHLPKPLSPPQQGFTTLAGDAREAGAKAAADFIRSEHAKPYFLWVNFINPHDICFYAINDYRMDPQAGGKRSGTGGQANKTLLEAMKIPEGLTREEFLARRCPPLPPNHEVQEDEPASIRELIARRSFRRRARETYSAADWRLHRWAYHRLTELVDRRVQVVLEALREANQERNTVVILTSDHGDHDAAHKLEHKSTLYEEAANVPFVVMHKGTAPPGRVDGTHLVSSGLDLLPTVCDYAGLPDARADRRGRSLRPLIEGETRGDWRTSLGVEAEVGRMVVSGRLKYARYDLVGEQEQLLDLERDPGEEHHVTNDPAYADRLKALRKTFEEEWFPA